MRPLNPSTLVVLGESLASGLVNFTLHAGDQRRAFPRLVAQQLDTPLQQPLFEAPGIGEAIGFPSLPVLIPHDSQTTVLRPDASGGPFDNLSIPGLTLSEALDRRPGHPLVRRDDARQTAINYVLGSPEAQQGAAAIHPTQLEYALARKPTLAIVELGFAEAVLAGVTARADALPSDVVFREAYARVVAALRSSGAAVVVTTIPDPMDTAACSSLESVSRVVKMPVSELQRLHRLKAGDRLTVAGLVEIGLQIMAKQQAPSPLPAGSVVDAASASAISTRIAALNQMIQSIAQEQGALVADFARVYRSVQADGLPAGSRTLSADFLGGFYSLNGYTPGATGQAALANAVIDAMNLVSDRHVTSIDLATVAVADAVADYRGADGPAFRTAGGRIAAAGAAARLGVFLAGFVAKAVVGALTRKKYVARPESGNDPSQWTLKLPSKMIQTLPIDPRASYYGDALTPVHTTDPAEQSLGLTGRWLFGGLGLFDSHLNGKVRLRFYPPVDNVAHFEVTHPGTLKGTNTTLTAPLFFRLAGIDSQVMDSTSIVSAGDVSLVTGEVTNLSYALFLLNSAILALAAVNPALPKDPIPLPGQYGRAWARFDPRPDGLLDYTCYLCSFIPLSVLKAPVRFPLPFTGPSGSVASVPADGTALHPHFSLSTRAPQPAAGWTGGPVPTNTVQHVSNANGRWQVQFGSDFGGTVSVAVRPLPAADVLRDRVEPVPSDPMTDDRFNLPVGAIDTATGAFMPQAGSRLPSLRWNGSRIQIAA